MPLTKDKAKFIHVRHHSAVYGVRTFTVAYHLDEATNRFYAGFAYCSLKDSYDRKKGSALALQRLNAGLEGQEISHEYFLPLSDVTLFVEPAALREFAVMWGYRFA